MGLCVACFYRMERFAEGLRRFSARIKSCFLRMGLLQTGAHAESLGLIARLSHADVSAHYSGLIEKFRKMPYI